MIALLDHLGLEQVDLVGFSLGAGIALRIAMDRPQRVRRLVVGGIGDAAINQHHDPEQIATIAAAFRAATSDEVGDPVARRIRYNAELGGGDPSALLPFLQSGGWPGGLDRLGPIDAPTLLFTAGRDQYMATTNALERWLTPAVVLRLDHHDHHSILQDEGPQRNAVRWLAAEVASASASPTEREGSVFRSFHVRLIVADFEGCFRFYRDVLGLRVTWGEEADGSASGYASFEIPGGSLSINDQSIVAPVIGFETRSPGEPVKDRALLVFEVESVDAEAERLLASGVALETEPTTYPGWGIRAAHLRDPDGNLIEINELLPPEDWSEDLRKEEARYQGL